MKTNKIPFNLNEVHCGDALEMLRRLPDSCVQVCVTSPPYWNLRDYGTARWEGGNASCDHKQYLGGHGKKSKTQVGSTGTQSCQYKNICSKCGAHRVDKQYGLEQTPQEFVAKMVDVFKEVRRVLRPDGLLFLNLGDSYVNFSQPGGGDPTIGKRNIGGGKYPRMKGSFGLKPKNLCGIPWRVAFALQEAGWYLRCDIIWSKPNPMPESVQDRPTKSHEYLFLLAKSDRYYYDAEAIKENTVDNSDWNYRQDLRKGKSYDLKEPYKNNCPGVYKKKVPSEWNTGQGTHGNFHLEGRRKLDKQRGHSRRHAGFNDRWDHRTKQEQTYNGRNKRSVWEIATKPYREAHFATFPTKLVEPCILAGSSAKGQCSACGKPYRRIIKSKFVPQDDVSQEKGVRGNNDQKPMDKSNSWEGFPRGSTVRSTLGWNADCVCNAGEPVPQIILDPFAGSGTAGEVALRLGRKFIGFDLNPEYCQELATPRLAAAERGQAVKQYKAGQTTIYDFKSD